MSQEKAPLRLDVLSLFPEYFSGPFDQSMIKKAKENGLIEINLVDIRDFSDGRHKQVDDRPYGGGPGMVMMAPPVVKAIRSVKGTNGRVVHLSPQGKTLTAKKCRELAGYSHLVFVCGHYEGIDNRAIELEVDEEISIGDYVLSNGCIAAIVVIDAFLRFVPGYLGHEQSAEEDSFASGLFDCPHYTRPELFEGLKVPDVLLSGNHKQIENWRKQQSIAKTGKIRPDLLTREQMQ